MKLTELEVTKASGEKVPFIEEKLRKSLLRSGAEEQQVQQILSEISFKLYSGIPTKKIYQLAFKMLKSGSKPFAARYRLKQGIMELGPSGFPFEKFIGEFLRYQGYQIKVGQIVKGKCVNHEIDVIAKKDNLHFMIECKYHNLPGKVCNVKIPLYIQARFKDVEAMLLKIDGHEAKFHQGWVVTNTRFTNDAIRYGTCAGLHLLGWDYPKTENLKDQIDQMGLYPLTCLTTITTNEKQKLLDKNIVLCKEISENESLLLKIGITNSRIKTILEEASQLCKR